MCDIRFLIMKAMPRARGRMRLNIGPPSTRASTTTRSLTFGARRSSALPRALLQHLLQQPRPALRLVAQQVERFVGVLAANQVGQRPHLAGADAGESMNGVYRPCRYFLARAVGVGAAMRAYFLPPLPP